MTVSFVTRVKVFKELNMHTKSGEDVFVSRGFHNWKLATTVFHQHELSACHKEAIKRAIILPATTADIGEAHSTAHTRENLENRQSLLEIL